MPSCYATLRSRCRAVENGKGTRGGKGEKKKGRKGGETLSRLAISVPTSDPGRLADRGGEKRGKTRKVGAPPLPELLLGGGPTSGSFAGNERKKKKEGKLRGLPFRANFLNPIHPDFGTHQRGEKRGKEKKEEKGRPPPDPLRPLLYFLNLPIQKQKRRRKGKKERKKKKK